MTETLYRLMDAAGTLLYVGISNGAPRRLSQHIATKEWYGEVASITFEHFESKDEVAARERFVITSEHPTHNIRHNRPAAERIRSPRIRAAYAPSDMGEDLPYMDIAEVATFLGITPGAIRDAVARGKLPAERRGGTEKKAGYLRFKREDVVTYKNTYSGKRGAASPDYPHKPKGGAE